MGYSSAVQGGGFWGRFGLGEYAFGLRECCVKPFGPLLNRQFSLTELSETVAPTVVERFRWEQWL